MTATETHRAIEAVWRIESARLVAALMRVVRDLGVAEELAQCEEALRLGRILAELTPEEPEVHGLVALMEIQASS